MRHALRLTWLGLLTLAVLGSGVWGTLFLWYATPGGPVAAAACAGGLVIAAASAMRGVWRRQTAVPIVYALACVALVAGFQSIQPRNDRDWAFDVAHPVRAEFAGDRATLRDVRDFDWRSTTDALERWETRTYDLAELDSLDVINSYWSGRTIAHTFLSFGFRDGRHLAVSVEIRRERDEAYSDIAGFFKRYELITIAADERDIVRLRTSVRLEDVELYRVRATPEQIRAMFREVMRRANDVAAKPAFYNSLTRNCTTVLFGAARAVDRGLPFDWRIILTGYLPDYLYANGLVDTRAPLRTLKELGSISRRGQEAGDAADFSARIRDGVPDPNQ